MSLPICRARSAGATATVSRQTLVEREDVEGTLGYPGKRTVVHRSSSTGGSSPSGSSPSGASGDRAADTAEPSAVLASAAYQPPADDQDDPPADAPEDDNPEDDAPADDREGEDAPDQEAGGEDDVAPADGDEDAADGDDPESSATPTLTAVAGAGSIVRRGGVLYRADGEPVVLMYGSTPVYRSLSSGVVDGRDVLQLERNLVALGFGDGSLTVDRNFTSATAAAVSEWQDALGVEETGSVELGQVVFLPGARRMGARKVPVGSLLPDGTEVVATTSTRRVVSVELPASDQTLARKGGRVTVTLPGGRSVKGRISSVGRVAREPDSEESGALDGGDSGSEPVIDVTVKLASRRGTGRLDEAPVTVGLARETRRNVLTVPVTALLAGEGGGYAVEQVRGGTRRIVPVETGLFASGLVEVSGDGVAEGMQVAVPE